MIAPAMFGDGDFVVARAALIRAVGIVEAVVLARIHYRARESYREAYEHGGEWWWNAPVEALADETGLSEKQVRRALAVLRDAGHVVAEKHHRGGSWDQSMSYRVALDLAETPANSHSPSRADASARRGVSHAPSGADEHAPSGADHPLQEEIKKREEPPSSPPAAVAVPSWRSPALREPPTVEPDGFDAFYAAWPRKVGRRDARRAWDSAMRRDADPAEIIAAAEAYASNPHVPPREFVPHPSTWLNRDGWADELPGPRGTERRLTNAERAMAEAIEDRRRELADAETLSILGSDR